MDIQILELIEGAKKAEGLTVVIDVFRAFTLECCLFAQGCARIIPVGKMEKALELKKEHPDWLLFGERGGAIVEGCDFGNSPSSIEGLDFTGKTVIHTTSAGTQGIANAAHADKIITGSLVNASAIAEYIRQNKPEKVCLVAMGNAGIRTAREDVICAEYIKALLEGEKINIAALTASLQTDGGEHFFDPAQTQFPEPDFYISTDYDRFGFVIEVREDGNYPVPVFTAP